MFHVGFFSPPGIKWHDFTFRQNRHWHFLWPRQSKEKKEETFLHLTKKPKGNLNETLKKISIFNWRIIALQYCVGFCHTLTWISHRCTYVPSRVNLLPTAHSITPLYVVTEHWFGFPASYSKFLLAIYFAYGNVYVSMLLSQFTLKLYFHFVI